LGLRSFGWLLSLGFRFPPRVSDQPIFYPVLTREYARQIARDWNTMDAASGFVGFVTQFEVDDTFAQKYPVQTAGGRTHQELCVPAEELEEFNRHIIGVINVIEAYPGPAFSGTIDCATNLPVDRLD
jgi:hypothetical protein